VPSEIANAAQEARVETQSLERNGRGVECGEFISERRGVLCGGVIALLLWAPCWTWSAAARRPPPAVGVL
jgi:hypothetical protein